MEPRERTSKTGSRLMVTIYDLVEGTEDNWCAAELYSHGRAAYDLCELPPNHGARHWNGNCSWLTDSAGNVITGSVRCNTDEHLMGCAGDHDVLTTPCEDHVAATTEQEN